MSTKQHRTPALVQDTHTQLLSNTDWSPFIILFPFVSDLCLLLAQTKPFHVLFHETYPVQFNVVQQVLFYLFISFCIYTLSVQIINTCYGTLQLSSGCRDIKYLKCN